MATGTRVSPAARSEAVKIIQDATAGMAKAINFKALVAISISSGFEV